MRILTPLIAILVTSLAVSAKKIEGTIFFLDNRELKVTFFVPVNFLTQEVTFQSIQNKIKYLDSSGERITLRPSQAKEIRFVYMGESIRMLSRPNASFSVFSFDSSIFLKLEIDGPLKLFRYYQKQQSAGFGNPSMGSYSPGYAYTIESNILQKGNGELMRPTGISFRKDMAIYFSDCPELVNKIQEKEFKRGDMEAIVNTYNRNCLK
jgi:hypothetical protein